MGYYNDFKIVFNCFSEEDADRVEHWVLIAYPSDAGEGPSLLKDMINAGCCSIEVNHGLVLEGSDWKLIGWDGLVCDIDEEFQEDPNVDFAWIRIGEDTSDIEIYNGSHTHIDLNRNIGKHSLYELEGTVKESKESIQKEKTCSCTVNQLMTGGCECGGK